MPEVLSGAIWQKKKNKGIQIVKEEVKKKSLFTDEIIIHITDSKNCTRKLLEIINKFNNVAVYRINLNKPIAFLYKKHTEKIMK